MQTQGIEGYCSQITVMVRGGLGLSRSRNMHTVGELRSQFKYSYS